MQFPNGDRRYRAEYPELQVDGTADSPQGAVAKLVQELAERTFHLGRIIEQLGDENGSI